MKIKKSIVTILVQYVYYMVLNFFLILTNIAWEDRFFVPGHSMSSFSDLSIGGNHMCMNNLHYVYEKCINVPNRHHGFEKNNKISPKTSNNFKLLVLGLVFYFFTIFFHISYTCDYPLPLDLTQIIIKIWKMHFLPSKWP